MPRSSSSSFVFLAAILSAASAILGCGGNTTDTTAHSGQGGGTGTGGSSATGGTQNPARVDCYLTCAALVNANCTSFGHDEGGQCGKACENLAGFPPCPNWEAFLQCAGDSAGEPQFTCDASGNPVPPPSCSDLWAVAMDCSASAGTGGGGGGGECSDGQYLPCASCPEHSQYCSGGHWSKCSCPL